MKTLSYFAAKIDGSKVGINEVSADNVVNGILNTVYFAAAITAIIVIIVCGIIYSASQGDAAKIKRAKDGILYSVVGIVVILFAFVVTNFVIRNL